MNIAFCDDQKQCHSIFKENIDEFLSLHPENSITVSYYCCAEKLLEDLQAGAAFQGFFLDIDLPGIDGFLLAQTIRNKDDHVPIIFISNYDTYLRDGYRIGIFRYLGKPMPREELFLCFDHCLSVESTSIRMLIVNLRNDDNTLQVKHIPVKDITRMRIAEHIVTLYMEESCLTYTIRESFSHYLKNPSLKDMIQISQNQAVNPQYVSSFSRFSLVMKDSAELTISRGYSRSANKALQLSLSGIV